MAVQPLHSLPAWLGYLLPTGRRVPDGAWQHRHNALVILLWAHAVGLTLVGVANGFPVGQALVAGLVVAFAAVGASLSILHRRVRACISTAGLLACSAILVHLTHGLTESHFHFFVMLALITLYEDWLPFVLAVGFVVAEHGIFGMIAHHSVYQNPAAQRSPVLWAFIHGGYVLAACAANLYAWRLVENERVRTAAAQDARDEALEASRLKSEFLATMSHEIRTPMNGVLGLTGLLLGTPLSKAQRQYAEGVEGAGATLMAIIDDIMDFSRLEAGEVDLDLVDLDLHRLVAEVADLVAPSARAKDLEVIADCRPDVPASLCGDGARIRQILLNLVSNAVKFTAAGEVVIKAALVDLVNEAAVVRLEVTDTGVGVDPADSERIFEPFTQQDGSTTRRHGGSGLGLAICRRLATAMHGELGVDSEPGRGSTFWLQIPLRAGTPVLPAAEASTTLAMGDRHILVVDDNATSRDVLVARLRAWGARTDTAASGPAALELMGRAAGAGDPFALAVLDLDMPEMDGLALAGRISADPALVDTPLLLLTTGIGPDAASARAAGVGAWTSKPVRPGELRDGVLTLLSQPAVAQPVTVTMPTPELPTARQPAAREFVLDAPALTDEPNVLIVEDNAVNQLVARGLLAKLGYLTTVVANGAEAVAAVADTAYAAILMDCHMPEMDGFEATAEIRRREGSGRRTPIIAMTASVLTGDRERCLAVGMDDYLSKPVDVTAFEETLARWCRNPSLTATSGDAAR